MHQELMLTIPVSAKMHLSIEPSGWPKTCIIRTAINFENKLLDVLFFQRTIIDPV